MRLRRLIQGLADSSRSSLRMSLYTPTTFRRSVQLTPFERSDLYLATRFRVRGEMALRLGFNLGYP